MSNLMVAKKKKKNFHNHLQQIHEVFGYMCVLGPQTWLTIDYYCYIISYITELAVYIKFNTLGNMLPSFLSNSLVKRFLSIACLCIKYRAEFRV